MAMFEEGGSQLAYIAPSNYYLPPHLVSDTSSQSRRTSTSSSAHKHYDALSIAFRDYSINDKFEDGLDFCQIDTRPFSPDPLHAPEAPLRREGASRYMRENGQRFSIFSLRGWLNFSAMFVICGCLIFAFVVWPIWSHYRHLKHRDSKQDYFSHLSGPFSFSDLPTNTLS